jgi:hypothetical protein
MVREVGFHFAKKKEGKDRWVKHYHKQGYRAKVEKASAAIRSVDGSKYVIVRGKKLKR